MAKMIAAGSYINDFQPVETLKKNLTDDEIKQLARERLGIEDLEYMAPIEQWVTNKCFVDLGPPDKDGITEALYNADGVYSIRTYKKRARPS